MPACFIPHPDDMRLLVRRIHFHLILTAILFVLFAFLSKLDAAQVHRMTPDEMRLFHLVSRHEGQQRLAMRLDPILCKVARERAKDMEMQSYFSHVSPQGVGPNRLVTRAGYILPVSYSAEMSGNNIESIAKAAGHVAVPFALWLKSSGHRPHLLGEHPFYASQTSVGVGVYRSNRFPHIKSIVLITAPPNSSKRPPPLVLKAPNGRIVADTRTLRSIRIP